MARLVSVSSRLSDFRVQANLCFFPSWTFNFDEDPYGEADIIEYAMFDPNAVSLHTCGACSFDLSGQPGTSPRSDCNLGGQSQGCPETDNSN